MVSAGFDHHALMDEVAALVCAVLDLPATAERLSYAEVFRLHLGLDPHAATSEALAACACDHGLDVAALDRDGRLDLLLSHLIQPRLGSERPLFIYDYPASQAALACLRGDDPVVGERFELYVSGIELANGYHELGDADEQRARFAQDNDRRRALGLPMLPLDERLLAALAHGLPTCAGVALGLDRLVMLAAGVRDIDEVMAFTTVRA